MNTTDPTPLAADAAPRPRHAVSPSLIAEGGGLLGSHHLAELYPLLEGAELEAFGADIRAKGLLDPVTIFEGPVLDGRPRFFACTRAGIEVRPVEYPAGDPLGFVLSRNHHRRHLTPEL